MVADIDEFKTHNDVHGHNFGDRLLTEIARSIKASTRRSDIAARFGGEEFAVIAPETSLDKALALAQDLRQAVQNLEFDELHGEVTMSFGVATNAAHRYRAPSTLLQAAEDHMYSAKRSGKNKVVGDDS